MCFRYCPPNLKSSLSHEINYETQDANEDFIKFRLEVIIEVQLGKVKLIEEEAEIEREEMTRAER